ncbi:hypothetical protein L6386_01510 [bacterium]|nr:hypothetical protein [bacterium]
MRRISESKKGVAVIMAMWLLAVLAIIGATFAFMMRLEPIIARHHRDEVKAMYVAQAGLDKAYDLLKAGSVIFKLEENLTDDEGAVVGTYEVNVAGIFFFTFAGDNTPTFYRYNAYKNEWKTMKWAPGNINAGGALAWGGGGYVYGLRGGTMTSFDRYKLSTNTWKKMIDITGAVDWGGALAHWYKYDATDDEYDHYLYATIGNSTTGFYFYDIDANSWTPKASTPGAVGRGGALAWAVGSDYIYALQGGSTNGFWRYSISNNAWEKYHCPECGYTSPTSGTCPTVGCPNYGVALVKFIPDAPGTVSYGGALAYAGGNYIYAARGGSTTTFWRYNIITNTWNPDPGDSPEITGGFPATAPDTIGTGGSLVWSGRDYLYALRGRSSNTFWRYKISTNTWNPVPGDRPEITGGVPATTPGTIAAGGSLTRSGDLYWIDSMGYVPNKTNPRAKKKIKAIVDTSAKAIVDNRIIYWKEVPED